MQFLVLGPFEVHGDNGSVALGSPKERRLLAMLVASRGEVVSADALIDGVWDGRPPRTAAKTLQGYVVHLRRVLAGGDTAKPLRTRGSGYVLDIPSDAVDAGRFRDLVTAGRRAAEARDWGRASVLLEEALGLWRGPPYAQFAGADCFEGEVRSLGELRLIATETRIDADLALGRGADLVPELEGLVAEHPTRERLWTQLMRALYRSGRQADALAAYRRARDKLIEELGVEPGPELRATEAAVLAQDPVLQAPDVNDGRPPLPSSLEPVGPSFEGRQADLAWLRSRWADAVAGRGNVVVVSGPRGAGKSRLLTELAHDVHRRGAVVHHSVNARSPSPSSAGAAADGRPVLLLLDEPLTALGSEAIGSLPVLVVAAIDDSATSPHVRAGFVGAPHRELNPLSDEVSRRIIDRYIGSDAGRIDVEQILVRAAGLPGRLHDLAAAAVEESAYERIGLAATATSSVRSDLAVARDDLRDGILDLRRGRVQRAAHRPTTSVGTPRSSGTTSPYLGLAHFDRADAALFHGRDALIAALVARVAETPLVAVIGASGSGKSSLVRAGLLAALADGSLPGSNSWPQHVLAVGTRPLAIDGDPGVVLVDQFEEAWTALDGHDRTDFLDGIVALADAGHHVVLALRADYVDRCAEHERLRRLIGEGTVLVGPMAEHEVRQAVTGPAALFGLTVEPALVDQVVQDVRTQPAALPLMSTALFETWQRRAGSRLTVAAYAESGGVAGAVSRLAETAFDRLSGDEQAAARRLFLRLAASGEQGAVVRRRVPLEELADDPATRWALDVMVTDRLVTAREGSVEVAHEALFTHWPRLELWLAEDEQGRLLREHLAPAALDWVRAGQSSSELYRGVRLDAAVSWARDHADDLSPAEREFIDASSTEAERELHQARQRADREAAGRRRLRGLAAVLALTLAVALVAAAVALDRRDAADDSARRAVARQLGAAALVEDSLDRSLLLAAAAVRLEDSPETRSDLLAALERNPAAIQVMRGDGDRLLASAVSADGRYLVVGDNGGTIVTWNLETGKQAGPPLQATPAGFTGFAARPGGREMVLAGLGATTGQVPLTVRWDPQRQQRIGLPLPGATAPIGSMAWSPDGRWLAGAQDHGDVLVWDFEHLDRPPMHIITGNEDRFRTVVSGGGRQFVAIEESGAAAVWLPGAGTPSRRFNVGAHVSGVAANPSATVLAVGHRDGQSALWDLSTGQRRVQLTSHSAAVQAVVFDAQGGAVASLGDDREVIVSDAASGELVSRLTGHSGRVTSGAFARDGRTLYTTSLDASIIAWDVTGEGQLGAYFGGSRGTDSSWMTVSSTGVVAVTRDDGSVRFWNANTGRPLGPAVTGTRAGIIAASFSPNGRQLATAAMGGTVLLWNVGDRTATKLIDGLPGDANEVAFSPDGRLVAVCAWHTGAGTIHIVDVATRRQVGAPIDVGWGMTQLAWSPDSQQLGVASWEVPNVEAYAVNSHRRIWTRKVARGSASLSIAWSPDGASIAVGDELGRIHYWDARNGRDVRPPVAGHAGPIITSAFSPDGRLLATAGEDGTVILLDVESGKQVGKPLPASDNTYTFARFDSHGRLFVGSADGAVWRWDVDVSSWLRRACLVAGRDLSRAEWADLDTGRGYQPVCG